MMKKLMACMLTLCLMASALIGGAMPTSFSAGAEGAAEAGETYVAETQEANLLASASDNGSEAKGATAGEGASDADTTDDATGGEQAPSEPSDEADPTQDETDDAVLDDESEDALAPAVVVAPVEFVPTGDYGSGPAYVLDHGYKHYGEPTELVALGQTIYLYQSVVLEITGYTIAELGEVAFALDADAFGDEDDVIYLSARDPNGNTKENTVYVWPGKKVETVSAPERLAEVIDASDEDILEHEIQVTPAHYSASEPCAPTFTLVSFPAIAEGMTFAVSVDGGEPTAFAGDTYTPVSSGEYRFSLLDADGAQLALSARFPVTMAQGDESGEGDSATDGVQEGAEEEPTAASSLLGATLSSLDAPLVGASEIELTVTAIGYEGDTLSSASPVFQLAGLPAEGNYSYAYRTDDGAWTQLIGDRYTATQSGAYTLSFVILDQNDEPVVTPASYPVNLDFATPLLGDSNSDGQAYALENGAKVYGTLANLLQANYATIYIKTSATIVLEGGYGALCGATLLPGDNYTGGEIVYLSNTKDGVESDSGIFVWVAAAGDAGTQAVTLTVAPSNLTQNAWTNAIPTFALSSSPDLPTNYSYAVSLNGGTFIKLASSSYTAADEGEYTLKFAIVDASGACQSESGEYSLKLDTTAPLLNVSTGDKYAMKVIAGDTVSGGQYVSIDGGKQWSLLTASSTAGVSYRQYSATKATTFAAGQIIVKDRAGNTAASTSAVTLYTTANSSNPTNTGDSATAGKTAGSSRTISHAKSTATDVVAYNGVELLLDDGNMSQLVVGDEALDLELTRDSFLVTDEGEAEAAQATPTFTAEFTAYSGDESDGVDTLILTATDAALALADTYSYTWEFSGVVYKKLAASGIDYLVLRIGDNVTVLSTAGFSAGIRYNMYRADGVTSKEFRYTVRMGMPGPTFEMDVTVGGETYAMTADSSSEFYYYDVYTGTTNQLGELKLDSLEG